MVDAPDAPDAHDAPEPQPGDHESGFVDRQGISLRRRLLGLGAFVTAALFFAVAVGTFASAKEFSAETQFKIAALYSEAKAEAAVDTTSLEVARDQFIEMTNFLADHMESLQKSNTGFLGRRAYHESGVIAAELRSISKALGSKTGDYENPREAIAAASERLRKVYERVDGAVPVAISIGNLHTANSPMPAVLVARLEKELDEFERATSSFNVNFPLEDELSEERQRELILAAEKECQESRLAFFLISMEWESRIGTSAGASLLSRFVEIERKAIMHCTQLRDALPDGPRKSHVAKFTKSLDRRLRASIAYQAGEWSKVFAILQEPFVKSDLA